MEQSVTEPEPSFRAEEPAPAKPDKKPKPTSGFRDFLSILGVLISAIILAFFLIHFVFQSYQVDGPSMEPTLENKDYLIIWKVPRTIAGITNHDYIPNRGDVIVFNDSSEGNYKQLIKRVVALPGERVTISDGVVTVYNQEHPKGFKPDDSLPYGKNNGNLHPTAGDEDVTVKAGEVYVLGDHRDNSRDSRYFGAVKSEDIAGKLVARVLPLDGFTRF